MFYKELGHYRLIAMHRGTKEKLLNTEIAGKEKKSCADVDYSSNCEAIVIKSKTSIPGGK